MNVPTYDEIKDQLHGMMKQDPKLKCCANCVYYNQISQYCDKLDKSFSRHMYGCKHFITAEERLILKAREELKAQARECEKIDYLLAMALTTAGATTLFIEDFERRVKVLYKKEKERGTKTKLHKDLNLADQMGGALKKITEHLEKIEQQYRFYIQSHLDKVFKKEGIYNAEQFDQFSADSGEFATFLLEMARVAHHNPENAEKITELMRSLSNLKDGQENTFCLDPKDIEHYRLKA